MEWQVLGSPALACPDLVNYATGDSNLTSPGLISRPFLSRIALGRHRLALSPSPRSPAPPRSPPARCHTTLSAALCAGFVLLVKGS